MLTGGGAQWIGLITQMGNGTNTGVGSTNTSMGGGGGGRSTMYSGGGGSTTTGGGGGRSKSGPANINTGRSTIAISSGVGGGRP